MEIYVINLLQVKRGLAFESVWDPQTGTHSSLETYRPHFQNHSLGGQSRARGSLLEFSHIPVSGWDMPHIMNGRQLGFYGQVPWVRNSDAQKQLIFDFSEPGSLRVRSRSVRVSYNALRYPWCIELHTYSSLPIHRCRFWVRLMGQEAHSRTHGE